MHVSEQQLDLERALLQDASGAATCAEIERYAAAAAPLQAALRQALPRAEYGAPQALHRALEAAQEVLESTWSRLHSNKKLRA